MADLDPPRTTDHKTHAILSSARRHFATHGFEDTKLASVAQDAKVAVGTIYLRYPGKGQLLAAVRDSLEAGFASALDRPHLSTQAFPNRFSSLITALLDHARAEPDLTKLLSQAPLAVSEGHSPGSQIAGALQGHIESGIARGELRPDLVPDLSARLLWGLIEGGIVEVLRPASHPAAEVIDSLSEAAERWMVLR